MKAFFTKHSVAITLLILLFIIGSVIAKDYGISWDEPAQREIGIVYYDFVFKGDKYLNTYVERDHGSGFELPLVVLEHVLDLNTPQEINLSRHLATHFFFLIGAFVFYLLCSQLFNNRLIGIIGFIALAGHPRLYAHSFFNSKDIPFLVAFIFCMYGAYWAYKNRSTISYLILGIVAGYATSIRMMSLLFIALVLAFLIIDAFRSKQNNLRPIISYTNPIVFLLSSVLWLFAFWPTLWTQPFMAFADAYSSMSKFRLSIDIFFEGHTVSSTNLPWHYLAKYMFITTPELWLIAGVIGIILVLINLVTDPLSFLKYHHKKFLVLNLSIFFGTLLAIIILNSVVYDGWRHVFFLYVSFLILALYAIALIQKKAGNKLIVFICIIQLIFTGSFMINNHPYQTVYFNRFIPHYKEYIRTHYEMDYWCVSFKQGLEYLIQHTTGEVKLYFSPTPVDNNTNYLPPKYQERIKLVDCEEADYFMTSFRWHPKDFDYPEIVFEKKVLNSTILRIYKTFEGEGKELEEKNCGVLYK